MQIFRIHGDNIIECERIIKIITGAINIVSIKTSLLSPSVIVINLEFKHNNSIVNWQLELFSGFNKNSKKRWENDIFDSLRKAGGYFDETPDIIISKVFKDNEQIILGIEFCSALQAGNQAWQRSARAFSIGKTGCPYLYVVDFVKYELVNTTRKRKNLRFPNAVVPYSYIAYSKKIENFVAQLYIKSEEFDKTKDKSIKNFDESNFADDLLSKV